MLHDSKRKVGIIGALMAPALLAIGLLAALSVSVVAQESLPVCFWSHQGMVCVERATGVGVAGLPDAEGLLSALLVGPTASEQLDGIWSAIPEGTTLEGFERQPGDTVVVRLGWPAEALSNLDHGTFEVVVEQIAWTLEPVGWRDLRIQVRDPATGERVPLAAFLPEIPAPRKETLPSGEEPAPLSAAYVGQPPAHGQAQPAGALTDKTIYVSQGHGWEWEYDGRCACYRWRTQRVVYEGFIEDHNNAEAVDQYLLQYLWNAGAMIWPMRERDRNGSERIVNNDDATGFTEQGTWMTGGFDGYDLNVPGTYLYTDTVTGTATATATWTAVLPEDGVYAVYVWYRAYTGTRPEDARYTVHHAGGETTVLVDQQVHGITWHHIGTYGFRGGEVATVALSNLSSVAGKYVIADAVRFGGGTFDSLYGIETNADYPPDKPWWEVATFYYAQKMGMGRPDNDVVARPLYARWEHAFTGDDAVYVSWHTNGYDGTARGTETYVHNGEGLPRTPGSTDLRDAIHTELVNDIRAGWDPFWTDRGVKEKNLGELRLLWDEVEEVQMPGALVEIAYHDNPEDAAALKEPAFQMLAARAVYQGIVKYFAQRDGKEPVFLPEPPTHLAVQNVLTGQVRISWRPPLTDSAGLAGHAASGYRVYTSTDGLGWSNGVSVTGSTVYTLTGPSEGQLLFVRVTATNDGGESFPTETLAVRIGEDVHVLVVNGFDRLNRTMLVPEIDPVEGDNLRMSLEEMNRYDYVIQHGEAITLPFDSASNEAVQEETVVLDDYEVVDWILGEESVNEETLNGTEQALLGSFLESGGGLFISGAEVAWDLCELGSAYDCAFFAGTLRAAYAGDDAETYEVTPTVGSIFAGLGSFRFDAQGMYDADYPDQILPTNGSVAALAYSGGNGGTAAIQYAETEHSCPRVVYFGFPFETVEPSQRQAVMARAMGFFAPCLPRFPGTWIGTPAHLSAHNTVPPFAGTAAPGGAGPAVDRVAVQVQDPAGSYWSGSDWAPSPTWITASGTSVWSYTLPALSTEGDHHLRARAWAGVLSDTTPAEAVFTYDTIPPTRTRLITPTGGISVTAATTLMWEQVDQDAGSLLGYVLQLDGQLYTTTQTAHSTGHLTSGLHTWGVQVFDAAGNRSEWVTDTFVVEQYLYVLPMVMRNFGEGLAACTNVLVNGGFETDAGWTLNQLAVYDTTRARSGWRSARVGIPPGHPGEYAYSSVMQQVALPLGSSATLWVWAYPISENNDADDRHYVTMYDQWGFPHYLESWHSNSRTWELHQYDLSAYVGMPVWIYVGTMNDGDDDTAAMYVDDAGLEVCP